MIRLMTIFFTFLLIIASSVLLANSEEDGNNAGGKETFQKVDLMIDFTDYGDGSVEDWLEKKGFQFERDAKNRKKLDLEIGAQGLILDCKSPMLGIIVKEGVDLEKFASIRLEWGVIDYPEGASYEEGVRNEALMVIVFFGYNKVSSGHLLIPNAPHFIGFFLGKEEEIGKSYVGRYFRKSGRYVCLGKPKEGEMVISEFNLVEAFKREFKKDEVPLISGLALSIDTTKAKNRGKASAFIKGIDFLGGD